MRVAFLVVALFAVASATAQHGPLGANGHGVLESAAAAAKAKFGKHHGKDEIAPKMKGLLEEMLGGIAKLAKAKEAEAAMAAGASSKAGAKSRWAQLKAKLEGGAFSKKMGELKAGKMAHGKQHHTPTRAPSPQQKKGFGKGKGFEMLKAFFAKLKADKGKKHWGKKHWGKKHWGKKHWGKKHWGKGKEHRGTWSKAMRGAFFAGMAELKKKGGKKLDSKGWRQAKGAFVRKFCAAHPKDAGCAKKDGKKQHHHRDHRWSKEMRAAYHALEKDGKKDKARFARGYCARHTADAFCAQLAKGASAPRRTAPPTVATVAMKPAVAWIGAQSPPSSETDEEEEAKDEEPSSGAHGAAVGILGACGLVGAAVFVARRRRAAAQSAPSAPVANQANQVPLVPLSYEVSTQEYSML